MPAWPVPVGLAFKGVASHFEVVPIGVQHTLKFIRRDGDGAVHEVGEVRCGYVVHQTPVAVGHARVTDDRRAHGALGRGPAPVLGAVPGNRQVRRSRLFIVERGTDGSFEPFQERFHANAGVIKTVVDDVGPSEIVTEAIGGRVQARHGRGHGLAQAGRFFSG